MYFVVFLDFKFSEELNLNFDGCLRVSRWGNDLNNV